MKLFLIFFLLIFEPLVTTYVPDHDEIAYAPALDVYDIIGPVESDIDYNLVHSMEAFHSGRKDLNFTSLALSFSWSSFILQFNKLFSLQSILPQQARKLLLPLVPPAGVLLWIFHLGWYP